MLLNSFKQGSWKVLPGPVLGRWRGQSPHCRDFHDTLPRHPQQVITRTAVRQATSHVPTVSLTVCAVALGSSTDSGSPGRPSAPRELEPVENLLLASLAVGHQLLHLIIQIASHYG